MTLLDDAIAFRSQLEDLNAVGQRDLLGLWRSVEDMDARSASVYMTDAMPVLVDEYAGVAGAATASFYDAQLPGSTYRAVTAPTPSREQVEGSTRWAMGAVAQEVRASPLDRLSGAFQRLMFQTSRDTVALNAEHEPGTMYARHASVNACKFCQMLATRAAVYATEASAVRVGADRWDYARNWKGEKRGESFGTGGRIRGKARDRGNQKSGDKYHDHCKCIAVPVRAGQSYEPPDYVSDWESDYKIAAGLAKANGDSSTTGILREWERMDRR